MVEVELRLEDGEVLVFLEHTARRELGCPECGEPAKGYDTRPRCWRHLGTCLRGGRGGLAAGHRSRQWLRRR